MTGVNKIDEAGQTGTPGIVLSSDGFGFTAPAEYARLFPTAAAGHQPEPREPDEQASAAGSVAAGVEPETFTFRQWIEGAWCAGYYDAGYTHDSEYAHMMAEKFANEALVGAAVPVEPATLYDGHDRQTWFKQANQLIAQSGGLVRSAFNDTPGPSPTELADWIQYAARTLQALAGRLQGAAAVPASEPDARHLQIVSAAESLIGFVQEAISSPAAKRFDDYYVPRLRAALAANQTESPAEPALRSFSDSDLRLMAGEMSASEIRLARAIANGVVAALAANQTERPAGTTPKAMP